MIAYLKKEDCTKETELDRLKQLVVDLRTEAHREREALIETYSQKIAQLEASLSEKDEEVWYLYMMGLLPSLYSESVIMTNFIVEPL